MNFKKPDAFIINTRILKFELSKYENLPFHLAMLYLSLQEGTSIHFLGTKLTSRKVVCDFTKIECEVEVEEVSRSRILDGGIAALNVWFKSSNYRSNPAFYKKLASVLDNQASLKININTKFSLKEKGNIKHSFIYARNPALASVIKNLTIHFSETQGYIPRVLLFPFLYFHKNAELRLINKDKTGNTLYSLRYDHVNKTLKAASVDQKRSLILTDTSLTALYGLLNAQNEQQEDMILNMITEYEVHFDKKGL